MKIQIYSNGCLNCYLLVPSEQNTLRNFIRCIVCKESKDSFWNSENFSYFENVHQMEYIMYFLFEYVM